MGSGHEAARLKSAKRVGHRRLWAECCRCKFQHADVVLFGEYGKYAPLRPRNAVSGECFVEHRREALVGASKEVRQVAIEETGAGGHLSKIHSCECTVNRASSSNQPSPKVRNLARPTKYSSVANF